MRMNSIMLHNKNTTCCNSNKIEKILSFEKKVVIFSKVQSVLEQKTFVIKKSVS